jgi:hypothetical protein
MALHNSQLKRTSCARRYLLLPDRCWPVLELLNWNRLRLLEDSYRGMNV